MLYEVITGIFPMISYLLGILALGLVILTHELGHFAAARLFGVTVETFSLGWGPVIFRKKKGDIV